MFPSHEFVFLWFNCQILNQRTEFRHDFLGLLNIIVMYTSEIVCQLSGTGSFPCAPLV